jgi:hypothetical protein
MFLIYGAEKAENRLSVNKSVLRENNIRYTVDSTRAI